MTKGPKGRSLLRMAAAGVVAVGATAAIAGTANAAPDKLCQMLNSAPGNAAAAEKYCTASATPRPEFCIPT